MPPWTDLSLLIYIEYHWHCVTSFEKQAYIALSTFLCTQSSPLILCLVSLSSWQYGTMHFLERVQLWMMLLCFCFFMFVAKLTNLILENISLSSIWKKINLLSHEGTQCFILECCVNFRGFIMLLDNVSCR